MLSSYRRIGLILLAMVLLLLAIPTQTWANPLDGQLLAGRTTCTACNGTGSDRYSYIEPPQYSGISPNREYCRICQSVVNVHTHRVCSSCGGTGYRTTSNVPTASGGNYAPSGGSGPAYIAGCRVLGPGTPIDTRKFPALAEWRTYKIQCRKCGGPGEGTISHKDNVYTVYCKNKKCTFVESGPLR